MSMVVSQMTGVFIVYSTVSSGADRRKQRSSASLAFVRGIRRWPVISPAQKASNEENISILWRHDAILKTWLPFNVLEWQFVKYNWNMVPKDNNSIVISIG